MNSTPVSPTRRQSREIIIKVIEDSVFGPVQCLPNGDVLELRKLLRDAYPFGIRRGYQYEVWCSEVRFALGYQIRKTPRYEKLVKRDERHVMPAMREWARQRGILVETPEFDPDAPEVPDLRGKVVLEIRHMKGGAPWVETFDASDLTDPADLERRNPRRVGVSSVAAAKSWATALVKASNATLKGGELAREVVSVRFIPEDPAT